jgi:pimeloyl-ACP methyl ester carboxylesterase
MPEPAPTEPEPRLHVLEHPAAAPSREGLPYLLVHGSMDRSSSFGRVIVELRDVDVIAYDRRGYARSSARPPSDRFADQVDDLMEVLGGRRVVALGHSFGGGVVLATAAAHPEAVAAAVVWEPPMPWLDWWPSSSAGSRSLARAGDPEEAAEAFMIRMVGERIWQRLPPTTRRRRREEGRTLLAEMRSIRTPAWDPAAVTVPVIVGRGGESRPHHQRSAAELARRLPDGTLRIIPGARHGAHLSHPAELAGLLRDVAAVGTAVASGAESAGRLVDEENPA